MNMAIAKKLFSNRIVQGVAMSLAWFLVRHVRRGDLSPEAFASLLDAPPSKKGIEVAEIQKKIRSVELKERRKLLDLHKEVRVFEGRALIAAAMAEGSTLEEAVLRFVRASFGSKNRVVARSLALNLLFTDPSLRETGLVACGVFFYHDGFHAAAMACFDRLGHDKSRERCPFEFFAVLMETGVKDAAAQLGSFLDGGANGLDLEAKAGLLNLFAKHLQLEGLAGRIEEILQVDRLVPSLSVAARQQLEWMSSRLAQAEAPFEPLPDNAVSIAVMGYKMLDRARASSNHGDYVQTLAALSNLCRFSDVTFEGEERLGEYVTGLQQRVKMERRIEGVSGRVRLVALDRDFASGKSYPDGTWLVSNGWFMHRNFHGAFDFPYPASVRPIFVSFHVNNPDLLSDEVVDYLRRYQPIGCRDWTTVYWLRARGVVSFFSGCLTTTVGQIFEAGRVPVDARKLAVVEAKLGPSEYAGFSHEAYVQIGDEVRDTSLTESLEAARRLLDGYLDFSHVATSRLHCYLPCRSMGLEVDFRPKNRSDVRFEGLLDLDETAFAKIREGLEAKLEAVLCLVVAGAAEDVVRAKWAEICAADVMFADEYCATYPELPPPSFDIENVLGGVRSAAARKGPEYTGPDNIHVAFALDQNLADMLPAVVRSLAAHTQRPVTAHILSRGLDRTYLDRLAAAAPQIGFILYDFTAIDYGEKLRMLMHTTVSTMDRLLLPELLKHIDKILYLDVDILVEDDVGKVFDMDIEGKPLAGKFTTFDSWKTGTRLVMRASLTLKPEDAWHIRRRLHHEGSLAFNTFNAGVVLLNLRKMRADRFSWKSIPLIENFAFNDQDALNVYARDQVVPLAPRWNLVPSQDYFENPGIIHWAGQVKPWGSLYIPGKERFLGYSIKG